jgi:hypothetical protein
VLSHWKGKVNSLLLIAIIWTASSDAARQACGEAAARWGNAQAVAGNGKAQPSRDTSHGLHVEGKSLFDAPDSNNMDHILGYGPGPEACGEAAGKMLKM